MPIAGIGEHDPGGSSLTPAASSSRRAALTIGSICPKSADEFVSSAAITIWRSVAAACGLSPRTQPRGVLTVRESGSVGLILPGGVAGGVYGFGGECEPSRRPLRITPRAR